MKKILTALLFIATLTGAANAQRRSTVSGVVADADTRAGLIGALVAIFPESDSTSVNHIVSGAGGAFSTGLAREPHTVEVSLLGYETLRRRIEVVGARTALDTLYLRQGIQIDAVVKEAVALRTSVSGDTLIYNADAYKVAADANVSGLLEKMPGLKVEDGAVEAQGEAVKKVLIDGREFFGEDVSAAISALPAEAVKSIEVFDKLSDNAEFTGIDDGEGYKAINIVTRESMRQGVMGQVSALYGVEPPDKTDSGWHHYGLVGANVSIFQGDAKFTVGGTLNNLNERHFTSEDILGAGDDDGIANVGRFQANYIDEWGKRNQWKFDASYSYDLTDMENHGIVDREYFEAENDALYRNYYSDSWRNRTRQNHTLRARIDFKPNSFHELRVRPVFRYQGDKSHRNSDETYFPIDGNLDNILLENWQNSRETGWMAGLNVNYRVRLGKPGRTLSMMFNGAYDPDDFTGASYSERQDGTSIRQSTPSNNYRYDLQGGLTYTEPISPSSLLSLEYNIRYNFSDNDRRAYLWDLSSGGDPRDPSSEAYYDDPEDKLSGIYNSGYLTHRVGPGYRMQKGKTTLSAGVFYQRSTLESTRVLPLAQKFGPYGFDNVTYTVMFDSQFGGGKSLRLFLNSRTRNPDVDDLQDVPDISNVQNITKGDPNLKPSYDNRLYARLILPNTEKGRTLAFNIGAAYAVNSIARRTISESPGFQIFDSEDNVVETLDAVGRYSEPVNMDGEWSARFGVDYGFPLTFMKSNLNLDADITYMESPSQMGKWNGGAPNDVTWMKNYSRSMETEGGITLGSNISDKIDFRVDYEISYNNVRNTFSSKSNSDYLRHRVRAEFKFVLPLDFTIAGNMNFNSYDVLRGQDFSQTYFIANAAVGKKIFRSKLAEVSLFVNDIFNQNINFRRRAYPQYIQNEINSAVGRYVGVKFAWNIRRFGKNGSQNIQMYNIDDHGEHSHGH